MKSDMLKCTPVVFVEGNWYGAAITECNLPYLSGNHSLGISPKCIHVTSCPHARHRKGNRVPGMSYSNAITLVSTKVCSTFDMVLATWAEIGLHAGNMKFNKPNKAWVNTRIILCTNLPLYLSILCNKIREYQYKRTSFFFKMQHPRLESLFFF